MLMTKEQILEEERIQERVRAKFNPKWKHYLLQHLKMLGKNKGKNEKVSRLG